MANTHFSFSPAMVGFAFLLIVLHFGDVSSAPAPLDAPCSGVELASLSNVLSCSACETFCIQDASGFGSVVCSGDDLISRFFGSIKICHCCQ
ncbi:hypothetical protein MKW98_013486 [Papaver atlanticum]|uniref:Uncharacterized protein n=1 Tax=Papaver atlanticum TaxID=357466 RepID=A0AAD4SUE0_9MAGN|nr:hypothetical protein MKW98_013486 [Papaver atlanticum]